MTPDGAEDKKASHFMSLQGLLSLVVLLTLSLGEVGSAQSLVSQVEKFYGAQDDLGLRIFLKERINQPLSVNDWLAIRRMLSLRPNSGFDLIFAWDKHRQVRGLNLSETNVDKALRQADALLEQRKFEEAFRKYQAIARAVKTSGKGKIRLQNRQFYFSTLHSMARALYGAQRFEESLEVYGWIPPYYYQVRQIQFEKMWAAFRAGRYDKVVGAIASQQSGYFSKYLDPESYLIKVYIMKRLCREQDVKYTMDSIQSYLSELQSGQITYREFARRDLLMSGFDILIEKNSATEIGLVTEAQRTQEKKKLKDYLVKIFDRHKPRLLSQLQKVLGYSKLALSGNSPFLSGISNLEDSETLEKKGLEFWPATGGEEWLDEIGSHVYVGQSQCSKTI